MITGETASWRSVTLPESTDRLTPESIAIIMAGWSSEMLFFGQIGKGPFGKNIDFGEKNNCPERIPVRVRELFK
jgi:hypothetical protein